MQGCQWCKSQDSAGEIRIILLATSPTVYPTAEGLYRLPYLHCTIVAP